MSTGHNSKQRSNGRRTQVCVLLDETGSMVSRKRETISGYNEYLQSLRKDEGDEVLFTLTTFNTLKIDTRYNHDPVDDVQPLTDASYQPDQGTPLYDAIGKTMSEMKRSVDDGDLVIFTILTDGEENSSREYRLDDIKKLIQQYESTGWKFVFLGVGIDAFAAGTAIGLTARSTFDVAEQNVGVAYSTMAAGTARLRSAYSVRGLEATRNMEVLSETDRGKLESKDGSPSSQRDGRRVGGDERRADGTGASQGQADGG